MKQKNRIYALMAGAVLGAAVVMLLLIGLQSNHTATVAVDSGPVTRPGVVFDITDVFSSHTVAETNTSPGAGYYYVIDLTMMNTADGVMNVYDYMDTLAFSLDSYGDAYLSDAVYYTIDGHPVRHGSMLDRDVNIKPDNTIDVRLIFDVDGSVVDDESKMLLVDGPGLVNEVAISGY